MKIEKKFENFSVDINYNYATNLLENKPYLPKINIDLGKLIEYYKTHKELVEDLVKEIKIFNNYYESLTKWVDMSKCETLKEKSIIYYLFYFMTRCFFSVIMHNNFIVSEGNKKIFLNFFTNFVQIIKTAKLYLEDNIENSSMIIEEDNNSNVNIEKNLRKGLYEPFNEIKNHPTEFNTAVINCHNFITFVLLSVEQIDNEEEKEIIDPDMLALLEIFVQSFNILHEVNEYYSILDYRKFYNDSISRDLNIKREFRMYLHNERIKKKQKREEEKNKKEDKKEDKKDNNNNLINDIKYDDDEEDFIKDDKIKFTLFDYMWLFNPAAKNDILFLFNEYQQQSEIHKFLNHGDFASEGGFLNFFLNRHKFNLTLNIRRDHLIEDTLNEVSKPDINFQNKLKVKFVGEQGVDEGGVRKEFFILLIRQIFDPNYGMFTYNDKTRLYWFNHYTFEPKIKYELIGIIFGLAIYNSTILDVKLPITIYKKLLGIKPDLEDMKECDPELYTTLNYLKTNNSPNLKEELDTNFTVIDDKFGEKLVIPLKPNGENIMIDSENKDEYVDLYVDWFFNKSINDSFSSFEKGFYRVFNRNLSKILTPDELELIICGTQFLDFNELKRVCQYEEYEKDSETINYFWEILLDFNEEEKKKFLSFVTGCDRAPIDGLGSLPITISKGGSDLTQLPSAHTCFNNLILPDYKNKEKLKKALLTAINYSEGFGLI